MRNKKIINIQVIAEIGVNHNGNLSIAKKLIDGAKKSMLGATGIESSRATGRNLYKGYVGNEYSLSNAAGGYLEEEQKLETVSREVEMLIESLNKKEPTE